MTEKTAAPAGYHTITPYIRINGAPKLIEFAQRTFGAAQIERHDRADGSIMHAELRIGDSVLMIGEAFADMGTMPACLYVYVNDTDAHFRKALEEGAEVIMEPTDMFWGDRFASVRDPFGNEWCLATRVEDVSPEELERRAQAFSEPRDS